MQSGDGDQMIGAGADQDFPLTGLPVRNAPTINDIDAWSGVQAPVFAPAADVARGLDALLEQLALVIESAGIGEAVGSLEASGQAPAFAGPQRRCLPIPTQAHQPLEADGPSLGMRRLTRNRNRTLPSPASPGKPAILPVNSRSRRTRVSERGSQRTWQVWI